jgi:phosphoserine phosphatase
VSAPRLVLFDCDSTLSAIEGVDELARARGPEQYAAVEAMTNAAMEGKISVESVFGRRLEVIRPNAQQLEAIARRYLETIEPTAIATMATLRQRGWTPAIVSGGFRGAIRPLADALGIERVEAVDLRFDAKSGEYLGFDEAYPTTRSGGKPEVVRRLRTELAPARIVMIGDGVSDLETKPEVDLFVGFGRYVERPRVRQEAHHFIHALAELPDLLH